MLTVGLTGGIGAGKSTVGRRLSDLGAVLIDADVLAREVIAPGSRGLAEVVDVFGAEVLDADGGLDRAAMARRIFADPPARARLEGIIHPLVRQRTAAAVRAAPADAVVVNDVPLLAETGLAPTFDLVVVVEAPQRLRLERLTGRGLPVEQAHSRIAAQAGDDTRRAVADAVIDNSGTPDDTRAAVDALWHDRLVPFEANKRAHRSAVSLAALTPYRPDWPGRFARLAARLRHVLGATVVRVDHVGSTAVPGLAAADVIDVQVTVADIAAADAVAAGLDAAGFPRLAGEAAVPFAPEATGWRGRGHGGCDPHDIAHIHISREGSRSARYALLFVAWLRADDAARDAYAAHTRALARHDGGIAQRRWFEVALPAAEEWATRTGWRYGPGGPVL